MIAALVAAVAALPPLVYQTDPASGHSAISVLTAHGSRVLASDANANVTPAWSPDGRQIAFSSSRHQADTAWIFSIGSDGRRIASASDRAQHGHRDIYIMPSTGGAAIRATHCPVSCTNPDWRRGKP